MEIARLVPTAIARSLDQADCAGPVDASLIAAVERTLSVSFPADYRAFLRRYGAALLRGFEIYGLVRDLDERAGPIWPDLRIVCRQERFRESVKRGFVPISDDGGDYVFYLDCASSRPTPDLARVVVFGPGKDGVQVAPSFFDFFELAARRQGIHALVRTGDGGNS